MNRPDRAGENRLAPFTFDVHLLADIDADPSAREREWGRVFAHYDPRLRDFFAARVPDSDTLDDLLAVLWRRALRGLPELRHPGGAWNWLVRVGLNAMRDGWRRDAVRAERHAEWLREEGEETAVPAVDEAETADHDAMAVPLDVPTVLEALEQFAPVDQAVLRFRLIDGLDHQEIAERVGLPSAAAARQRFSRARVQLQRLLQRPSREHAIERQPVTRRGGNGMRGQRPRASGNDESPP